MMRQLKIATTANNAETLSDLLFLLGAVSVTFKDAEDQPIYEPPLGTTPLWHEVSVSALFTIETAIDPILQLVSQELFQGQTLKYTLEEVAEQDWAQLWMTQSHPLSFGKRLWICPSHQQVKKEDAIVVMLDPGLAFGTGNHPTTALCLNWLDENIHGQEIIIDYGCGSGILAIAALKLGANQALAVDNDPQALQACQENAERNAISSEKIIINFPETFSEIASDVLIANILANPLVELAPRFASLVKPNGKLVLSGILSEQIEIIKKAYQSWFSFEEPIMRKEWVLLEGRRMANF